MKFLHLLPFLLTALAGSTFAEDPLWIWHTKTAADGEVRYFRKEFTLTTAPAKARLSATCDNELTASINGRSVGQSGDWKQPLVAEVGTVLHKGANVIAVRGKNHDGVAAIMVRLEITNADGSKVSIVSDESWLSSEKETADWDKEMVTKVGWQKPAAIAKLGDAPWGDVLAGAGKGGKKGGSGVATPAEELATLPGFKVELVLSADKDRHGSWCAMTMDDQGRLILGSQQGNKISRITIKDGKVANDEDLQLPFSEPMGMLFYKGSLYINGKGSIPGGKSGHGIYRLQSTKNDGHFDKMEQLMAWGGGTGGGEHGSHGLVVGPDGKLYVVSGNFTDVPVEISANSPHRNYAEDLVLGRAEDGNGFGANRKPPGGFILRMDLDGKNAELFAAGERNTYDIAFNGDGELFGFDSDMEWDWGMPWYRPIRVFHAVSGGEQGFREGTGKWPEYYPDSMPAAVNIGIGCPTGVLFGTGAKFPARYQRAFYVLDWTYGRLVATHLQPNGASYGGTWENLVAPKSLSGEGAKATLNLTDAMIGADGAMYFTTGGRGTQAGLYRVTYAGSEPTAPASNHDEAGAQARQARHQLEAYDGKADDKAVSFAWAYMGDKDRALRYAARIAIESQPLEKWKDRVLQETNPVAALNGLLALARVGGKESQPVLMAALDKIPFAKLDPESQLAKVRVVEVSVSRHGLPGHVEALMQDLDAAYPAASVPLNRELCQTLIALGSPTAVGKTVKLLQAAPTQEEQITYLLYLRQAKVGWTPELRKGFLGWWLGHSSQHPEYVTRWFKEAGRPYADGSSFNNFLANFHRDALQSLTAPEIDQLQKVLAAYVAPNAKPPRKAQKQHTFVKMWTMADLDPLLGQLSKGRNFGNGRDAFAAGQCILCHRFGDEGGAVGPDLTSIATRFSPHDIAESIVDPSKVVSEQYANEEITLKNGDLAVGRIVGETTDAISVRPSLLAPDLQQVKKADIKGQAVSKVSPMPPGLISMLSQDDVLDLLAYLISAGKQDAPAFMAK